MTVRPPLLCMLISASLNQKTNRFGLL
jgi:hypothetical protein